VFATGPTAVLVHGLGLRRVKISIKALTPYLTAVSNSAAQSSGGGVRAAFGVFRCGS
jgi:hypothetical protein